MALPDVHAKSLAISSALSSYCVPGFIPPPARGFALQRITRAASEEILEMVKALDASRRRNWTSKWETVTHGPDTQVLVKRRKAIRNIRKITRTMELIATARFKKAFDRAVAADAYAQKITELASGPEQQALPISSTRQSKSRETIKNSLLLVICSNRGLCGGYNASILREANHALRAIKEQGSNLHLELSGKRAIARLPLSGHPGRNDLHAVRGQAPLRGNRGTRRPLHRGLHLGGYRSGPGLLHEVSEHVHAGPRGGSTVAARTDFVGLPPKKSQLPSKIEYSTCPVRRIFSKKSCRWLSKSGSSNVSSTPPSASRSRGAWP